MKSFLYSTKHCLFCLYGVFFRPSREFFTHLAIEQLGFFNVPHLLYTSQPFKMVVTPTHVAEHLAVRLSLPGNPFIKCIYIFLSMQLGYYQDKGVNIIISVLERTMRLYVFVFKAEKYAHVNRSFLPVKTNVSEVSISITQSIQCLNTILEIFYFKYT